jgi:hypothetical protein
MNYVSLYPVSKRNLLRGKQSTDFQFKCIINIGENLINKLIKH